MFLRTCKGAIPLLKAPMSSSKKKVKPIVRRGIPADPSVIVKAHEFKRGSGSRFVSTTSLSSSRSPAPSASQSAHEHPNDPIDGQIYSDVDDELLENVANTKKKKQSRSVSVSAVSRFPPLSSPPLPSPLLSSHPNPTNRHCWRSGSNTKTNSWTSTHGWSLHPN